MGSYGKVGEYERDDTGIAYSREAQATSYYRDRNTQRDYEPIHATSSSRKPTDYFSAIASGIGPVTDRFGALQVTDRAALERPSVGTEHIRQAMRTVELAESAIMQKIQENEHTRTELRLTNWELQTYKQDAASSRQPKASSRQSSQMSGVPLFPEKNGLEDPGGVPALDKEMWPGNRFQVDSQGTLVVQQSLPPEYNNHVASSPATLSRSQHGSMSSTPNASPGGLNQELISQATADCTGFSPMSSSSSRFHREGDFDSRPPLSGQALMLAPEIGNQRSLWKQDLFLRVRTQEEDILQLQRRLADNAIKELKILNEKHVLEKRIAGMRMAFDQQQQDLVDAASKALSYRHDILEENVRMTYALQAAEQERSIFVSSLLPLLTKYDFQPLVTDAHSIVSNVKVLIQHLHEKLNLSEAKLKDSQYQLTSLRADPVYQAPYAPQSPFHPNSDPSHPSKMNGVEILPRTGYVQGEIPSSPVFHGHNNGGGWKFPTVNYQHGNDTYHGVIHDHMSTFEPQAPANGSLPAQNDTRSMFPVHAKVNGPYAGNEVEETTGLRFVKDKDQTPRDTARNSPYLPMLPEESNTYISEEDDLLPAIENFQITGEPVPGNTLEASGISINGTSLCVFQWFRHFEDGTECFIEGAGQPQYTITADDVDAWISIECTPLNERGRQGNLVRVFVNETNKITCDAWWKMYGVRVPLLQKLAVRILSQTCSSSGCERNWSVFEKIHNKKRNRLESHRLNDMVYVYYNLRLWVKQLEKTPDTEAISLDGIDTTAEWRVETERPLMDPTEDWLVQDEGEEEGEEEEEEEEQEQEQEQEEEELEEQEEEVTPPTRATRATTTTSRGRGLRPPQPLVAATTSSSASRARQTPLPFPPLQAPASTSRGKEKAVPYSRKRGRGNQ